MRMIRFFVLKLVLVLVLQLTIHQMVCGMLMKKDNQLL